MLANPVADDFEFIHPEPHVFVEPDHVAVVLRNRQSDPISVRDRDAVVVSYVESGVDTVGIGESNAITDAKHDSNIFTVSDYLSE